MSKTINIKDKLITIYDDFDNGKELPIVFYNSYKGNGEELWNCCKEINCKEFILVVIQNIAWDDEMTPWAIPPLFKGDTECKGKADEYLDTLTNWYPNFLEYIKENNLLNKPNKIYFSLGDKEKNSKNKVLCTVEDKTLELVEYYRKQEIDTNFEFNKGGHFEEGNIRMAKGIKWVLE